MEINCKLTFNIPEELIDALGISEDTVFETYYENGSLHIHPLTEAELAELEGDIDAEDEAGDRLSVEVKENWECDGDCEECIFEECCPYDDVDCDPEGCDSCEYFCNNCGCCVLECGKEND